MKPVKRERKCLECGGRVREIAKAGRAMPYRNVPALTVPRDVELPTCEKCGELYLDAKSSKRLDHALEGEYRALLSRLASAALDRLGDSISKQQLEVYLGLSQGYLSKLPGKPTSAVLVNLLTLLAADPKRGLKVVRSIWEPDVDGR
jgi:hypothetical protein